MGGKLTLNWFTCCTTTRHSMRRTCDPVEILTQYGFYLFCCRILQFCQFPNKMASVIAYFVDGYRDLMDNKSDPRVNDWFLMSGPMPTALICLTYVFIVKYLGPKLMENRKPFELRQVLIWYNAFQVAFSTWLFYECMVSGWWNHYSLRCQPVDYSDDPLAMRMARGCWWYFFSKFTEFFDTFFFVMRKKNNHISTLHVIHHGVMPLSVWFGVKFTPGGHSSFFGLLNTFVHIIMYAYYLVAALGPQYQKFIWWKKYLTALQMVQFVAVMVHAFQLLFTDCNYPRAFVWWIGMHAVMFYFLFANFYKQSYTPKSGNKKVADKSMAQRISEGVTICHPGALYQTPEQTGDKMIVNGFTSPNDSTMRNRAYVKGSSQ